MLSNPGFLCISTELDHATREHNILAVRWTIHPPCYAAAAMRLSICQSITPISFPLAVAK